MSGPMTSSRIAPTMHERRAQGVSTSTIRRDFACLSSLLTSAQDWEWIEVNPKTPMVSAF